MSQEGAIAPKEAINIVYKPAGEGTEQVELPLKILSLGDYIGQKDARPLMDREPISVDKDNFPAVMREHKLEVELTVPNKLLQDTKEESEIRVHLRFDALDDFTPEGVAQQVPELRELLEMRNALTALKYPISSVPELQGYLKEMLNDPHASQRLIDELGADDHPPTNED